MATVALSSAAFADNTETVIVTGSRIPVAANVQAPTAVTTISSDVLEKAGTVNVADMLRTVPSFGVSGLTPTNSAFLTGGAGISTLELRNLGEDRTLVLVNGRRYVSGNAGSSAVDFNTVPTDMIDRVEVITGGASAIYGSDALAGVINVILKDDFQGVAANAQYGRSDHNDDIQYKLSTTIGGNFGNDKGNAFLNIAWTKNQGVMAANRHDTAIDNTVSSKCTTNHLEAFCQTATYPTYSSFSAYGDFVIPSTGAGYTVSSGTGPTGTVSSYVNGTYGFNRQAYRVLETPVERLLIASRAHYDVTDTVRIYAEATFANTIAKTQSEPFGFGSDAWAGRGDLGTDSLGNVIGIPVNNPYMPAALRTRLQNAYADDMAYYAADTAAGDTDAANADLVAADSDQYLGVRRRLVEFGPRNYTARRDLYRVVIGAQGSISNDYKWDTYFNWGHTLDTQNGTGQVNIPNLRQALNAHVVTAADFTTNLVPPSAGGKPAQIGDVVCNDYAAQYEGCVPVNLFGLGSITPEAMGYIVAPQSRLDNIDQQVAGGTIAGPVPYAELPGGKVQAVVGFEYRREYASDVPDALTQTGQNAGNKELPTVGGYHVLEFFTEVKAPILADLPFAKEVTFDAAWRWSQYNTQGVSNAYSGNLTWSPIDDLHVRGQFSHAVRAPNIGELFAPGGENFAPVSDVCDGITATTAGQTATNCRTNPAIAGRIAATGSFTLSLPEIQGTGGFSGKGNTLLKPEIADTWSVGTVFSHNFENVGQLTASVDWYNIKVNKFITTVGRQQAVQLCYSGTGFPNQFCNLLVRKTTGPAASQGALTEVNNGYVNEGWMKTSGLDVSVQWQGDLNDYFSTAPIGLNDAGQIALRTNWSWLQYYNSETFGQLSPGRGSIGAPTHKIQSAFIYSNGPFSLQWELDIQSSVRIDADPTGNQFYRTKIGAYFMNNLSLSYDFTQEVQGYFGVNNIFDRSAPNVLTSVPGNTTGSNTAEDVYDAIGRRYFVGVRVKL